MVSKIDRAKQFLPFSALSPLEQALREKEKEYINKFDISNDMIYEISKVVESISKDTCVNIKYYYSGQYLQISGKVNSIDSFKKSLIVDNYRINFDDILEIDIL